jgi:hypothetical protein
MPVRTWAQLSLIPEDSTAFKDFLILQKQVQGLSYQFFLPGSIKDGQVSADSTFRFSKTDSGYVSVLFSDFGLLPSLEDSLLQDSLPFRLDYVVFSKTENVQATQEYLSNLVRNGDYELKFEEPNAIRDLVLLASRFSYYPFTQYKLSVLADYKLFAVTVVIVFFFLSAFSMIIYMLVMKAQKNNRERLQKEYDQLVIDPLTSLLFEKELDEIRQIENQELYRYFPQDLLSKPLYRDVLIERIIGLNKKMKGEFKEKLKVLYRRLDLDKTSIQALKNKRWDKVAAGIVQINEMDLVEGLSEVKKHANSSNFHIRSQALGALLNLSEKVDLSFLRDQTYPLSVWQQMNYLRIIRFISLQKDLKLDLLFESKNESVRIFGYKLVRVLGRMELIEVLSELAPTVSDEEKIEILETFIVLGAHQEVRLVNHCLTSANPKLVMAAAKAACVLGNQETVEIISRLLESETVFSKKMALFRCLYELDKVQFDKVTSVNVDWRTSQIRAHLLDPNLHHV